MRTENIFKSLAINKARYAWMMVWKSWLNGCKAFHVEEDVKENHCAHIPFSKKAMNYK